MTLSSKPINKQALWSKRITAWEASELSQPRFCEQNNISYSAFGYWRSRLKSNKSVKQPVKQPIKPCHFLPINIKNPGSPALTLKINNAHSIALSPGFDPILLSQIIQVVQSAA